jgi:transcriptional regulator with PAS, ATPase and Fis domain
LKVNSKLLETNAKSFLNEFLKSLATEKAPRLSKEHLHFFKEVTAQLKHQCLGENCSPQEQTVYLMTLKTAFIKFLQEYYQGKKFEMHQEFQDFANILDLLGFFIVQNYSETKEGEIKQLRKQQGVAEIREKIIGNSQVIHELFQKIEAVLDNDITVLIEGETGTGKELIAQAIHYQGPRKEKPFIAINCAAIPSTLLEAELFGYERGAFTGADQQRPGKFEIASEGTFFLDEIGELTLDMQVKLLRVLQSKQVVRLGGHEYIDIDVRIIAATNKNLRAEVGKKNFREDLYYRLAVFPIAVPPLRERENDVLLLAKYFLDNENQTGRKKITGFGKEALTTLKNYSWPGNIRELENVIKRGYVVATGEKIETKDLMFLNLLPPPTATAQTELATLEELEKDIIKNRLKHFGGNMTKTAKSLGITRATLYKKLG